MLKVVLHPVLSSQEHSDLNISTDALSTLISKILLTKTMAMHGTLQVKLANGWGWSGEDGGSYKITVTLNCQIDRMSPHKSALLNRISTLEKGKLSTGS